MKRTGVALAAVAALTLLAGCASEGVYAGGYGYGDGYYYDGFDQYPYPAYGVGLGFYDAGGWNGGGHGHDGHHGGGDGGHHGPGGGGGLAGGGHHGGGGHAGGGGGAPHGGGLSPGVRTGLAGLRH